MGKAWVARSTKVQLLGALGFCIALYALEVESHLDEDDYEATCDIQSMGMSCSKVFNSSQAHILSHWGLVEPGSTYDLSLAILGLALYAAYFVAGTLWSYGLIPPTLRKNLFLMAACGGACFSCYLLYVLKFELGHMCVVCTGFHIVNFSMLSLAIFEYRRASRPALRARKAEAPAPPCARANPRHSCRTHAWPRPIGRSGKKKDE